jgi:hypothetical protein
VRAVLCTFIPFAEIAMTFNHSPVRGRVRRAAAVAAVLALVGCAGAPDRSALNAVRSQANPTDRAQRTITNFTPALRCMDEMMFHMGTRDITMMMEEFRDATQKVPVSARDMLTSAVSDMTRRSRGVRLSVFGSDQQNLTQALAQAQRTNAFSVVPAYNIRGTVSQLDESVLKDGRSFGATLAQSVFGVRFGSETKFSVLGLDAAVVETDSMTLLPGVSSKNTTVLASRDASAADGQAQLVNPGIGVVFSFTTSRADGPSQAARNMVELAAVELVGKLLRAPYWQCLGTADTDAEVQRELADWFLSMDEGERIAFYKERMRERRYYDGAIDGQADAAFDAALQSYRKALGLPVQGAMDQGFFRSFVLGKVPRGPLQALPRNTATRASGAALAPVVAAAPAGTDPAAAAAAAAPPPAPDIPALAVALAAPERGSARLDLAVQRPGYVYCYSQDPATRRIQRIFPNRFERDPRMVPGQARSLPGNGRFVLNPAAEFACLHAPSEVYGDLPPPLRWGDFEDIRVGTFEEIRAGFTQASGMPVQLFAVPK